MRNLLINPAAKEQDLGISIPDSPHACSVCFPTWESVVDYEDANPQVIQKMLSGYPRFFFHPIVQRLMLQVRNELMISEDKVILLLPTKRIVSRARRWMELTLGGAIQIEAYNEIWLLIGDKENEKVFKEFWQHTGEILSSRYALDIIERQVQPDNISEIEQLRERIAEPYKGGKSEDVYIYETGMSAWYAAHRTSQALNQKKTLQIEFPYLDLLKIQQKFSHTGVVFLTRAVGEDFTEALRRIEAGDFNAVYAELPSNPLLHSFDLEAVSRSCAIGNTPLIIDDTVASVINLDILSKVDVVVTSLSKWFSGQADVLAGSVILNPESKFYNHFKQNLEDDSEHGSRLYAKDISVLLKNSEDYKSLIHTSNANTLALLELLKQQETIESLHHPSLIDTEMYNQNKNLDGGYGGLFSIVFKTKKQAIQFYNQLEVSKGPSLGTEYTLACPYTLLAHYNELEWAENCGIKPHLIRISVGVEPIEELLARFTRALEL